MRASGTPHKRGSDESDARRRALIRAVVETRVLPELLRAKDAQPSPSGESRDAPDPEPTS